MHRPEVGQRVLATVRQHQHDPLAGRQPQRREPGRHLQHPLPGLLPGQRPPAGPGPGTGTGLGTRLSLVGVRVGITRRLGHLPQFIAQRAPRDRTLDLSPLPHNVAAHHVLHPPT
jgi:hypothetical protein